jgi:rare lipoprotein A
MRKAILSASILLASTTFAEADWCRLHSTGQHSGATTASWYGPGYHGRQAADGSIFDQNKLTAAHPNLPFGTKVRVTRMDTGSSVVVTITDRFCFRGRALDLSKEAARRIGMLGGGTAVVHWAVIRT